MEVLFAIVASVASLGILAGVGFALRVSSHLASIDARLTYGDQRIGKHSVHLSELKHETEQLNLRVDRLERPHSSGATRTVKA